MDEIETKISKTRGIQLWHKRCGARIEMQDNRHYCPSCKQFVKYDKMYDKDG